MAPQRQQAPQQGQLVFEQHAVVTRSGVGVEEEQSLVPGNPVLRQKALGLVKSPVGEGDRETGERFGPFFHGDLAQQIRGQVIGLVHEVAIALVAGQVQKHIGRGGDHVEHLPAPGGYLFVADEGAAVQIKVILVFTDQCPDRLQVRRVGEPLAGEDRVKMGYFRVALEKAGHGLFDHVIDPGAGEIVPEGRYSPGGQDGIPDVDVRDHQDLLERRHRPDDPKVVPFAQTLDQFVADGGDEGVVEQPSAFPWELGGELAGQVEKSAGDRVVEHGLNLTQEGIGPGRAAVVRCVPSAGR